MSCVPFHHKVNGKGKYVSLSEEEAADNWTGTDLRENKNNISKLILSPWYAQ